MRQSLVSPRNESGIRGVAMTTHLEEYLAYYSKLKAPKFAVLVTGEWGTGKTFQVRSCIPEGERIYVSLFGVQTVDQIHSEVLAAAFPLVGKANKAFKQSSDAMAGAGGVWALAGAAPALISSILKRSLNPDSTLIFDDLERCVVSPEDVLGAINSYVEHLDFRVVLIAHDEHLAGKFLQFKEKVIGQTLRVVPNTDAALARFMREIESGPARQFISSHERRIKEIFTLSSVGSLRILRHVVQDLARLFSCLDERHLKNSEAMLDLVATFVAFAVEVRFGRLSKSDLTKRRGQRSHYLMRRHADNGGGCCTAASAGDS